MPKLDPEDVYPVRNLPGPAEPWGRALEADVRALKKNSNGTEGSVAGMNRTFAASLENLSKQLSDISVAQTKLSEQNSMVFHEDTFSMSAASGFETQVTVPVPTWATHAYFGLTAVASISSTATSGSLLVRIEVGRTPITSLGLWSTSFSVGSGAANAGNEGVVLNVQNLDNIYIRPYRQRLVSGSGATTINFITPVFWVEDPSAEE